MTKKRALLKNFTILYVEDDQNTARIICDILKDCFKEVYFAPNGVEGLELYKNEHPDIVLSDIQMPKMNGIELTHEIKKIKHTQAIALFTAFNENQYLKDAINLGVSQYILKPLEENQFFDSLLAMARVLKIEDDKKKIEHLLEVQGKVAAMGEMIGHIAHQWRQPLSVISTAASAIQLSKTMHHLKPEDEDHLLDNIVSQTGFLSQTIDDFQNFFKNTQDIKRVFNIKETIHKVIKLTEDSFKNRYITLINEVQDINIFQNENQLIQAFLNIFNNTKDAFMMNNTIQNRYFFIHTKKVKNTLFITFRDSAGGIDQSIIDKIFEPYFTTKHQYSRTGVVLFMTHQIITKKMKGTIDVQTIEYTFDNKKLKGAEFKIAIPLENLEDSKNNSN